MHKQTNKELKPIIRGVGCFYLSCVNLVEHVTGKIFTTNEINLGWDACKVLGYINGNNEIVVSAKVMNYFLKKCNAAIKCFEIATLKQGNYNYYESIPESWKQFKKYFIQKINRCSIYKNHFRVRLKDNTIIDSYDDGYLFDSIVYEIVYIFKEVETK